MFISNNIIIKLLLIKCPCFSFDWLKSACYLQEVNFMAMDVSKGDVLEGFQKLIGSVMIPALQKQEVCCNFLPENNLQINSHIY